MPPTGSQTAPLRENEYRPLDQLLALAEGKLGETLRRAASQPLYKKQKFDAPNRSAMERLRTQPFMSSKDLLELCNRQIDGSPKRSRIQLWQSGVVENNSLAWFPRGLDDIGRQTALAGRMAGACGIKQGDCVLVLSQPGHGATNFLPYALASALKDASIPAQVIAANLTVDVHTGKWVDFVMSNPPSVIIAEPKGALELAGHFRGSSAAFARGLRFLLLYGVGSAAECDEVSRVYGAEVRQSLGLEGLDIFGVECAGRQGIHMWLDAGVYEVIPENGGSEGSAQCGGEPASLWLWEAENGTRGELVVTNFGEVMPLIRYRTGRRVEVVSAPACACGRTHPRVRLL